MSTYRASTMHKMLRRPIKEPVESISLQDTVFILRSELGNLLSWHSWLCDGNKRDGEHGPATLHGACLKPCARVDRKPRYSLVDVWDFVEAVKAATPSARPEPVSVEVYNIVRGRFWRLNNVKRGDSTIH